MKQLKVASSLAAQASFLTSRQVGTFDQTDLTDIAAAVLTAEDVRNGLIDTISESGFDIPIFFAVTAQDQFSREKVPNIDDVLLQISGVFDLGSDSAEFYGDKLETAARRYEEDLLPPFFGALKHYEERGNSTFACPGHQGGQFFRKHPAGRQFFDFFGETLFRADRCNADVEMGDLLIHEGAPGERIGKRRCSTCSTVCVTVADVC